MSEEEFDELLDLMSENNLTQHGADTLYGEIVDREIERRRLNNIINELEKEFDSVIKDPLIHMCYKRLARKYADKLRELKGNDK